MTPDKWHHLLQWMKEQENINRRLILEIRALAALVGVDRETLAEEADRLEDRGE